MKTYHYDAFGNEVNPDAADTNPFRYCGQYFDKETGTYYLRARYYDPAIGRFISQDGMEYIDDKDPLSLNLYSYCKGNPVMYADLGGHIPFMVITALAGAIIGGAVGAIASAASGKFSWAAVGIGAAAGGLIGLGAGAAAGVLLAGSATASTASVVAGANVFVAGLGSGGLAGGSKVLYDNIKTASQTSQQIMERFASSGYATFEKLKNAVGEAGKGFHWHHIVEQSQIAKSGFSTYVINSTANIIRVSETIHKAITAHYARIIPGLTNGLSVRNWLAGQDFKTQYEYGLDVLRMFGVIE